MAADVTVKTASGDVTVGAVGGELRVHTASGDLRCSSVAGAAVFSTTSGDLELGAAAGRVEVKATSGDVRLGELSHGARIVNVSGDVRVLTLGEGALRVRSVSGDVCVGVARGVDLHVDVETMSGSVRSDIPIEDAPRLGERWTSGRISASAACRATSRSSGRSSRWPDQSRSWWHTASSMRPKGSSQKVAK